MAQIIRANNAGANLGQALGTGLSSGISTGLNNLINSKMQQVQQQRAQQQGSAFWKGLGLPDQIANQFALAPESVQKSLLDRLEGINIGGQQQQMQSQQLPNQLQQQAQQPQQQGGLRLGANPVERRQQAQLQQQAQLHREAQQQRAQQHSERLNAPVLKQIEERAIPARNISNIASELTDLLNTGKVITGIKGRFTPKELQTEEGQEFLAKINELVLQKAQLGKGVPTKLRLSLEQLSKPDVWQKPQAIKKLLSDIQNQPEIQRDIASDQARQEIIQEVGENQPKNIKALIEKRTKEILGENKKEIKLIEKQNKQSEAGLPPAKQFEGKIARNSITGERRRSQNGQWIPVGEGI